WEAGLYCHLGDGREFTLLELPWNKALAPPDASELVGWLGKRGMTPILAHPERHHYLHDDPARLRALVDAGAWLQITVDSLLGNHGAKPEAAGWEMLRAYPEAVLATDAHGPRRCSGLAAGFALVRERLGEARAGDLKARAAHVLQRLLAAS